MQIVGINIASPFCPDVGDGDKVFRLGDIMDRDNRAPRGIEIHAYQWN